MRWKRLTNHDGTPYFVNLETVTHIYRYETGGSWLMFAGRNNQGYPASIHVKETPDEILSGIDLS